MLFRDIPQYTREPPYQSDIPLTMLSKVVRDYTTDQGLDIDPDFQRGHVWTEGQQKAFVEHILRGGRGSHVLRLNHSGWAAGGSRGEGEFVLVDGKQRLTACLDFMEGRLPVFGGYYFGDFEDEIRPLSTVLSFSINNLASREEVLRWYLEINAGGTVHSKDELDRVRDLLDREAVRREAPSPGLRGVAGP